MLVSHLAAWTPINFSIDNQATIKAMQKNKLQPARYLIDEIHRSTKHLLQLLDEERSQEIRPRSTRARSNDDPPDSPISFTWIASHMNSIGNERAGTLAKDASENGSSPKTKLPPFLRKRLLISIFAVKQMIQEDIKTDCKWWWIESQRYRRTKQIDPLLPSNKCLEITSSLNRRQTSVLTQLRTGHTPINHHLHRIGKNHTPNCLQSTCTNKTEDVHHLIFTCPKYLNARHQLIRSIGGKSFTSTKLFADEKSIPHTLTYLNKT